MGLESGILSHSGEMSQLLFFFFFFSLNFKGNEGRQEAL